MALAAGAPCGWAVKCSLVSLGTRHRRSSAAAEALRTPNSWAGLELSSVGCRDSITRSSSLRLGSTWNFRKYVSKRHRGKTVAVVRGSNGMPYRPSSGSRRSSSQQQESDAPLMNTDIRVPQVRLLDKSQNMVGIVLTLEALQRAQDAELDLVNISSGADPPVVRIMDYSKYRYEVQKKKREAQKKAAASRQVLKELKMRYNIDTHDYAVRQRAAQK